MVGTDRQADVDPAAPRAAAAFALGRFVRAGELAAAKALTQRVEAGERWNRGTLALRGLLDGGSRRGNLGSRRRRRNRGSGARRSSKKALPDGKSSWLRTANITCDSAEMSSDS